MYGHGYRRRPAGSIPVEINRVFDDLRSGVGRLFTSFDGVASACDVEDGPDAVIVTLEVPGVSAADLEVTLEGERLTIRGEKRRPEAPADGPPRRRVRSERAFGRFHEEIVLPFLSEGECHASLADGVLTVAVPRPARGGTGRRVDIRTG